RHRVVPCCTNQLCLHLRHTSSVWYNAVQRAENAGTPRPLAQPPPFLVGRVDLPNGLSAESKLRRRLMSLRVKYRLPDIRMPCRGRCRGVDLGYARRLTPAAATARCRWDRETPRRQCSIAIEEEHLTHSPLRQQVAIRGHE